MLVPDPKGELRIFQFGSEWPYQPSQSWSRNHPNPDIAQGDHRLAGSGYGGSDDGSSSGSGSGSGEGTDGGGGGSGGGRP